ncbi:hypothetical protein [Lactiplantibacillus modestisalitolerans]|uniref:Uncharacterized protein n=1 Tax=Lactiplantibacillus modestisalitolerans TaxID=1457219 RepID=A0ABV5WU99_9LACO|nr:hypothetical protein [Lactiplantibacillus modestisalitolerans]
MVILTPISMDTGDHEDGTREWWFITISNHPNWGLPSSSEFFKIIMRYEHYRIVPGRD